MSSQSCGCDPESGWMCSWHRESHVESVAQHVQAVNTGNFMAICPGCRDIRFPHWKNCSKAGEVLPPSQTVVRSFSTGATRDSDVDKIDYEAFLSPLVIRRYGEYMHKHRFQLDGTMRSGDNWQKGIPKESYIKSAWRHLVDWWMIHRGHVSKGGNPDEVLEDSLCATIFNASGYLHVHLLEKES